MKKYSIHRLLILILVVILTSCTSKIEIKKDPKTSKNGITYCTVPTFFNDGGELAPGSEIMVILNKDSDLFDKGGEHTFDHAVIVTNPGYYREANGEFSELAYGVLAETWDKFSCTKIDQIGKE